MASKDPDEGIDTTPGQSTNPKISLKTVATMAELYPAHVQKKKVGPIGRKKQQGNEARMIRTTMKKVREGERRRIEQASNIMKDEDDDKSEHCFDNIAVSEEDLEESSTDDPTLLDNVTGIPLESWSRNGKKTPDEDNNKNLFQSLRCSGRKFHAREAITLKSGLGVDNIAVSKEDLEESSTDDPSLLDNVTGIPLESWFRNGKKTPDEDNNKNLFQAARKLLILSITQDQVYEPDIDELDDDGYTTLHLATQHNRIGVIEELISKGADVNKKASVDDATALHIAAKYNYVNAVRVLLKFDADVMAKLTNGQSPLHVASRKGHIEVVKVLVSKRPGCVKATDNDKTTPLHQAAIHGDVGICEFLVEHGAHIRAKDINDVTPLIMAAQCGFTDIVQYLLTIAYQVGFFLCEYIADEDSEGNTALHLAVSNRHINVARALIDRGAPQDSRKANGFTPLHQAAIFGEVGMVEMLIDRGAETEVFDNELMTPLHRAALYNRVDVILILIRQGLYLEHRDVDNFTPFLCAAWKGQTDAGRALLRYGADIQAVDKEFKSCLHWAVEMQHVEFVKMLFEHGHGGEEIVDWRDKDEQTALHYAALVGNVKLTKLLIEYSAKVNVRDIDEKSPLHIASESGHLDCVKVLLEASQLPLNDDDIDDMTPLLLASENGHIHVVKYLIQMGADMTKTNDDRRSPLALAAIQNEMAVMTVLLDNNSDVNVLDKDKNTPLHLCARAGHPGPATLLVNCGADLTAKNVHGQYPLDVALEYKQEPVALAILSNRNWEIAMSNRDANDQCPMQRLIQSCPEAAMKVLDQCVTRSHEDPHHPELNVTYDLKYVDPGPDDRSSMKGGRKFALETMVECNREKLLAHELSQNVLAKKWTKFAGYFNSMDFLLYVGFLTALVVYLELCYYIASYYPRNKFGCPVVPANYTFEDSESWPSWSSSESDDTYVRYTDMRLFGLQIYLFWYVCVRIVEDVAELFWRKFAYFTNFENWMHWLLYVSIIAFITPPYYPPCYINWSFGALASFVAWMNFIFVLQRYDFFGLYVTMFFTTLKSLLKAMVVYVFFIIGFAFSFFICFNETNLSFRDEWSSILTTFTMTLGEINKADLFDSGDSLGPYTEIANILFVCFLFLMPMVLINLTIGISVGDIDSILRTSYIKRYSLQVEMIFGLEKRFPKFIQRKLWQGSYSYYPNRPTISCWKKMKQLVIGSGRESTFLRESTDTGANLDDLMGGVNRHEQMLTDISVILSRQSEILRQLAEKNDIRVDL